MLRDMRSRRTRWQYAVGLMAIVSLSVALTGCAGEGAGRRVVPPVIQDYVTGVQAVGAQVATAVKGAQLPVGSEGGPAITVSDNATVVNGGSLRQQIRAAADFLKVRIAVFAIAGTVVSGSASSTAETTPRSTPQSTPRSSAPLPTTPPDSPPASGYLEVTLTAPTRSVDLVISLAQALPATGFVLSYALVDEVGSQGSIGRQLVTAIPVGTGEVQVSVSWDVDSDVDLHVVDPNSDEVYWRDDRVSSGGELDLDSNAECELDHTRNENITWSKAPAGEYVVRLDYWSSCSVAKTNYVVTVRVVGQPAQVFNGEFTGKGDKGGLGDGVEITRFTVSATSTSPTPSGR